MKDDGGPSFNRTWREVRELLGCSHQRAKAIVRAAREACPYPVTNRGCHDERYAADEAVIAALRAMRPHRAAIAKAKGDAP